MAEPVDIDPTDHDEIGEEDDEWGDDLMKDLYKRFDKLKRFNATLKEFTDTDFDKNFTTEKGKMKKYTIQLVADEIYDKMIKLFNDTRKKLKIEDKTTVEPQYKSFNLDDNGNLTFKDKGKGKKNLSILGISTIV